MHFNNLFWLHVLRKFLFMHIQWQIVSFLKLTSLKTQDTSRSKIWQEKLYSNCTLRGVNMVAYAHVVLIPNALKSDV